MTMSVFVVNVLRWSVPVASLFALAASTVQAQRVSSRDQAHVQVIEQQMSLAEQRYTQALILATASDPDARAEADAALADMEDAISACEAQRGCHVSNLLASYNRLLKQQFDGQDEEWLAAHPLVALADEVADEAELAHAAADGETTQPPGFREQVQYNPAIAEGIRRWLTDRRHLLLTSYENYMNLRPLILPEWEKRGLPEPLLFGIMATESNGRAHVSSRAGAAGLMQFMPATGKRFGLGPDDSGFDTRFDPRSAVRASARYVQHHINLLGDSVEMALAAYNGGEGRAFRVFKASNGRSFWTDTVFNQFPDETRDYVPMVIAAAWIFTDPEHYGVEFMPIDMRPTALRLRKPASIYQLTICLGSQADTRDGYMRVLRNLNPRFDADALMAEGTILTVTTRIAQLYQQHCLSGPRAELAQELISADPHLAIVRTTPSTAQSPVSVVASSGAAASSKANASAPRTYTVSQGDTLGRIASRFQCRTAPLAQANGLRGPAYVIRPGQTLKLEGCTQ